MKVYFVSLGCDKNLADSERMLYLLRAAGHDLTEEPGEAEAAVINTCCFIGDAKEESINTIIELGEYKNTGSLKRLIVAGCLGQRYKDEIFEELPEVDMVLGTNSWDEIVKALDADDAPCRAIYARDISDALPEKGGRIMSVAGSHYAYQKIAEGCSRDCSYCVIPSVRGRYRSYRQEDILTEAAYLAHRGVKELNLVAQETTLYGTDIYGEKRLPELLDRLQEIDGISWIRLLYCYPEEITDGILKAMQRNPKVCHYLDIPIQHVSDRILKSMGRRTRKAELIERIERIRELIPDIALRTTLLTGYPGETEAEHEELMRFVEETGFDRLGVFAYSREEGTRAYDMPDQIPEEIRERRKNELYDLSRRVIIKRNEALPGRELEVLVEGYLSDEQVYVGRTYRDAPEVDGLIFFVCDRTLMTGEMVRVMVTGSAEYDLTGEIVL